MRPVTLAELDPVTRELALKQIEGTTLAVVPDAGLVPTAEKESFTTLGDPVALTDDQLADIVIEGVRKIRECLPHIRTLKERFDSGDRDCTNRLRVPIKGCYSWKHFCRTYLDRAPQTIGEALRVATTPEPPLGPVACNCPDCGISFPSHSQLKKHCRNEHNNVVPASGETNLLPPVMEPDQTSTPPTPTPSAPSMTANEFVRWCSQIYAAEITEAIGTQEKCTCVREAATQNVMLKWFLPTDTAKKLFEYYLRLEKDKRPDERW